jgi:hypothetical protein
MKRLLFALLLCFSAGSLASPVNAETIYGIAELGGQTVISFDSSNPGALLSGAAISGLQSGETIKGIDFRPATTELYALGSSSRLYTLNVVTGVATEVPPPGAFAPALSGSDFGFDFNPVIDRIRVVSNTRKNYVLNPNDGSATQVTDLAYGPADPNFGVSPNVEYSAYTNSTNPAPATTQLYGIDTGLDVLVTQANSAGTLATVGPLGVNAGATGGFDISGDTGVAYASFLPGLASQSSLYSINLLTGAATNLGVIDGGIIVGSLAVAPDGFNPFIPEPSTIALLGLAVLLTGRRRVA